MNSICLIGGIAAFLASIAQSLPVGPTEIVLVHGTFDGRAYDLADMPKAYQKAEEILKDPAFGKSDPAVAARNWEQVPWYKLEQTMGNGLEDVGMLSRCIMNADESYGCDHCTAFYVGHDLLMSAGHCIVKEGITNPQHSLLFFVPGYDRSYGFTKSNQADLRVVKEWWVPDKYYNHVTDSARSKTSGFDFAFLRVDKSKQRPTVFYTIAAPTNLLGEAMFMVGYPKDTPRVLQHVRVDAKMVDLVETPAMGMEPAKRTDIGHVQLILLPSAKGVMHGGSSGSPVFRTATFNAQARTVVGMVNWSVLQDEHAKRNKATLTQQEASFTPVFNLEVVKIAENLRDGKGVVKTAVGEQIPGGDAAKKVSWIEWLGLGKA